MRGCTEFTEFIWHAFFAIGNLLTGTRSWVSERAFATTTALIRELRAERDSIALIGGREDELLRPSDSSADPLGMDWVAIRRTIDVNDESGVSVNGVDPLNRQGALPSPPAFVSPASASLERPTQKVP